MKLTDMVKKASESVSQSAKKAIITTTALAAMAMPAAAQEYSLNLDTTTLGSGVESSIPKDINYTSDTRFIFKIETDNVTYKVIGTNNENFEGGVDSYDITAAFNVGNVFVKPGVILDSKPNADDVQSYYAVLATKIAGNDTSVLLVRDNEGFSLVRPYFDGKNIDASSGHKWFTDGTQDQDVVAGIHRTDKNAGLWLGYTTNEEKIAAWSLDASYVHVIGFAKQRDDGTGFAEMHMQLGDKNQIGGKFSSDTGWGVIKSFISPAPLVGPLSSYLSDANGSDGVAAQIAYNKGVDSEYIQAQVGDQVGAIKFGNGFKIPLFAGGGVHYDMAQGEVKPVVEGLATIPLGENASLDLEVRASSDDAMFTARTGVKF